MKRDKDAHDDIHDTAVSGGLLSNVGRIFVYCVLGHICILAGYQSFVGILWLTGLFTAGAVGWHYSWPYLWKLFRENSTQPAKPTSKSHTDHDADVSIDPRMHAEFFSITWMAGYGSDQAQ